MIDIIDSLVERAKQVKAFGGRVYRAYPQLTDRMDPFMVITHGGSRQVVQSDDDGGEVIVSLTYRVTVFDWSPEDVDERIAELTTIYNQLHIQNMEYTAGYQTSNLMYTAQAVFSCKVDNRGYVYAR